MTAVAPHRGAGMRGFSQHFGAGAVSLRVSVAGTVPVPLDGGGGLARPHSQACWQPGKPSLTQGDPRA